MVDADKWAQQIDEWEKFRVEAFQFAVDNGYDHPAFTDWKWRDASDADDAVSATADDRGRQRVAHPFARTRGARPATTSPAGPGFSWALARAARYARHRKTTRSAGGGHQLLRNKAPSPLAW